MRERSRPLGEFEADQALVGHARAATAEVSQVGLGHLVVAEIAHDEFGLAQRCEHAGGVGEPRLRVHTLRLIAQVDGGLVWGSHAV